MTRIVQIILTIWLVAAFTPWAAAQQYDLVITGGRVMEPETGFDGVANVGTVNGRILAITQDEIKGKELLDAKGLVAAPGFIDGHQHNLEVHMPSRKKNLKDGAEASDMTSASSPEEMVCSVKGGLSGDGKVV